MKNFLFVASALLSFVLAPLGVKAAPSSQFYCGQYQGKPATLAKTSRGDVPIIVWTSTWASGSGFTPQKRCGMVSQKFQQFNASGTLKFLTTGNINGYGVLCAVKSQTSCKASDILLTLEKGENPQLILADLLKVRDGASGPIERGNTWINMDDFLRYAPTVEGNAETSFIPSPVPVAPVTPNPGSLW